MTPKDPIVPNIKPSTDDIALRQRQMQNRRASSSSSSSGSGSTLGVLGLLIALCAVGFSVYLFLQLEQTRAELNKSVTEQGKVVAELQERLSATGENASTSLEAQGVMVKENAQEIRKLWDIAYKRNRGNIADNEKSIKQLTSDLAGLRAELEENFAAKLTEIATQISGLQDRITALEASVLALPADTEIRLSQNTESIVMAERSIANLKVSLDKLKKLEAEIKAVDNRIKLMHPAVPAQ